MKNIVSIFYTLVLKMSGFGQETLHEAKIVIVKLASGFEFIKTNFGLFVGAKASVLEEDNLEQDFGFLVEKSPYEKKMSDNTSENRGFFPKHISPFTIKSSKVFISKHSGNAELATFNNEYKVSTSYI